jgi:hypothetical protein
VSSVRVLETPRSVKNANAPVPSPIGEGALRSEKPPLWGWNGRCAKKRSEKPNLDWLEKPLLRLRLTLAVETYA